MKSIGDQAKAFREHKGWNFTEMAAEVQKHFPGGKVNRQKITQLEEAGDRRPQYLAALAKAMRTTVEVLEAGKWRPPGEEIEVSEPEFRSEITMEEVDSAFIVTKQTSTYLPGFEGLSIPVLAQSGSMGEGVDQLVDEVVVGRLTVSPDWVSRTIKPLTNLKNLRFIHGYGDSMEPTFHDGDIMLVDVGVRDPDIDGIYVLEANERIYIKRVRQRLNGQYEVTSDNPIVKTVDDLNDPGVRVCGRVVWVWNGKKL